MRVRDRPRKRRAPQGHLPRVVANLAARARRGTLLTIFEGVQELIAEHAPGCRRPGGVVRRRRRPHRALRRAGARRRARRRVVRRRRVRRVRAGARQAGGVRLRARRQGAGAADGEDDPRARRAADAGPRRRRARGRDLPRARAAAARGGRVDDRAAARHGAPAARQSGSIVDVGGVGYLVAATPRVQRASARRRRSRRYLHVREDALQLYGFASADERELFELLLGVSGVGPEGRARDRLRLDAGRAAPRDRARRPRALRGDPRASAARRRSASCSS